MAPIWFDSLSYRPLFILPGNYSASPGGRKPERSSLYQVLYNYREEFELRWDELFQERYGYLIMRISSSPDTKLLVTPSDFCAEFDKVISF